ncbi:hypothetical protein cand_001360 [Cryptosporidium andersoni]|uniref:Uncharacterized protein n=1 Tax=Cryptosporidium andersoni TaxID=117008 RepID=A0A1J4MQF7_9CRYT|nr:hypothetical protein cand_001360 [Cryptosporidium andersoni]
MTLITFTILYVVLLVKDSLQKEIIDSRSPSGGVMINGYSHKPGIFYFLNEELKWRDNDLPFLNYIWDVIANSFVNLLNYTDLSEEGLLITYSNEIMNLAAKTEVINDIYKKFLLNKGSVDELIIYEQEFKPMYKRYRDEITLSPLISIAAHTLTPINAENYNLPIYPDETLDPTLRKFKMELAMNTWSAEFQEFSGYFKIMIPRLLSLCREINNRLKNMCRKTSIIGKNYLLELIKVQKFFLQLLKDPNISNIRKFDNKEISTFYNSAKKLRSDLLAFLPYQITIRKIDPIKADALGIPMFVGSNYNRLDPVSKTFYDNLVLEKLEVDSI